MDPNCSQLSDEDSQTRRSLFLLIPTLLHNPNSSAEMCGFFLQNVSKYWENNIPRRFCISYFRIKSIAYNLQIRGKLNVNCNIY